MRNIPLWRAIKHIQREENTGSISLWVDWGIRRTSEERNQHIIPWIFMLYFSFDTLWITNYDVWYKIEWGTSYEVILFTLILNSNKFQHPCNAGSSCQWPLHKILNVVDGKNTPLVTPEGHFGTCTHIYKSWLEVCCKTLPNMH